jgi:hypothetical protein
VFSKNAKKVIAPTRRKNKLARSAITAEAMTEAEGREALGIERLYSTSDLT